MTYNGKEYVYAKLLQSCPTLCDLIDGSLLSPWDSPGKNAGVGCHFLLQICVDIYKIYYRFLIAQLVKNPPVMQETQVQFMHWEDLLEKG